MTLRIWRGERPKRRSTRSGRQFANRAAALADQQRVLPMELQVGDRLSDETGEEWEVIGRPYATGGGKNAHARLQRVGDPAAQEVRSWSAYERITVRRAADEEGKR